MSSSASDRTVLEALLYGGDGAAARRLPPDRWLRSRAGREGLRRRCGRLAVRFVLRAGGALPEPLFDAEGQPVAEAPLWHPEVLARSEWRLSGAAARLLTGLWQVAAEPGTQAAELDVAPATAADVVFFQAVAEELGDDGAPRLARVAWACSPLAALTDPDRYPLAGSAERLQPWLAADWLVPYLRAWICRRWLAVDARRELLRRPAEERLNDAFTGLLSWLREAWTAASRIEHLTLLAGFYTRWLARRGGVRGVLRLVRRGSWQGQPRSQRERFERSYGLLLEPGLALAELATDVRRLGWQRTPAEEHFLGVYSRELEPVVEPLERLHRELCRVL